MAVLRIKNTKLKLSILILEVFLIIMASYFLYTVTAPKPQQQITCIGSPLCASHFSNLFPPFILVGYVCNSSGFFIRLGNNFENVTLQRVGTAILGESGMNSTRNESILITGSAGTLGKYGMIKFKNYACTSQNNNYDVYFQINYSTHTNSTNLTYSVASEALSGKTNGSGGNPPYGGISSAGGATQSASQLPIT